MIHVAELLKANLHILIPNKYGILPVDRLELLPDMELELSLMARWLANKGKTSLCKQKQSIISIAQPNWQKTTCIKAQKCSPPPPH